MEILKKVKPARSMKLTEEEMKALVEHRAKFSTDVDAAIAIGLDRAVMGRVILVGSGSEETVKKIRKALNITA